MSLRKEETRMMMGPGPDPWRKPMRLALVSLAAALLYWLVPALTGHTRPFFGWLSALLPGAGQLSGRSAGVWVALLYTICMGAGFWALGSLLRDLSRRPEGRRDRIIVFWGAGLLAIVMIFAPSMLSKDLFDYMAHGRILAHYGANPFVTPATGFPGDPFMAPMGWPTATPLYGPAWASMVAALSLAGGGSLLATALLFKLFFAIVHLANGWLIYRIVASWRGIPGITGAPTLPLRAAALYLWNPLVLTQTIADAHNDGVAIFWLLLGILLLQRSDDAMGSACAAMSVLIKYVTAPIVLLLLVQRWRERGLVAALKLALVCAVVAGFAYAPYLSGFDAGHFLRPYAHSSYQGGLMMGIEMILSPILGGGTDPGSPVATIMKMISLVAAALLGFWYLMRLVKTRTLLDACETSTRLLLFYLLAVTALLRTSYLVWIVALAAAAATVPIRRATALFSATVLSLEIFWVYRLLAPDGAGSLNPERFIATAVAVGVPILYLLAHLRLSPGGSRSPAPPAREA